MNRCSVYSLAFLLVISPQIAEALDESDSLALLVDALAESEASVVQETLLEGMLSGLEGRRNVTAPRDWSTLSVCLVASTSQPA